MKKASKKESVAKYVNLSLKADTYWKLKKLAAERQETLKKTLSDVVEGHFTKKQ